MTIEVHEDGSVTVQYDEHFGDWYPSVAEFKTAHALEPKKPAVDVLAEKSRPALIETSKTMGDKPQKIEVDVAVDAVEVKRG